MWRSEKSFVKYVTGPIVNLKKLAYANDKAKVFKFANTIGIKLTPEDKELSDKKLTNCVLRKWYPASEALLEMIVEKLPSPDTAQKYRSEYLYSGPTDDEVAQSIRECNPDGPLMLYISKMVPDKDKNKFFAFGRVFSGTIKAGQKINFYGPDYTYGVEKDYKKGISSTGIRVMMANKMEPIDSCPAGNTVCLQGVDQYILKNGTLSDVHLGYPFHAMKFSVSPVVRVAVSIKNAAQLPKFIKALQKLSKSDPLCQVQSDHKTGEIIVAGAGELHIDVIMNNLRDEYCKGIEFTVSEPVVPFKETIQEESPICLAKSPNNHNRLYIQACPLSEELLRDIEDGTFTWAGADKNKASRDLIDKYGWGPNEANPKRIWAFGPETDNTNVIIDCTSGVQYMNEIRDSVVTAFKNCTMEGVLCQEPMRGIMFKIVDATLHADNIHRGGGQVIPAARRAMLAAEYTGSPCVMEPIFSVNITAPDTAMGSIYGVISQRRGQILSQENVEGTPMYTLDGTIPVMESFGFDALLRSETSGQAFQQCSFSHWEPVSGSIEREESRLMTIVKETRIRKELPEELPPLDRYKDKL